MIYFAFQSQSLLHCQNLAIFPSTDVYLYYVVINTQLYINQMKDMLWRSLFVFSTIPSLLLINLLMLSSIPVVQLYLISLYCESCSNISISYTRQCWDSHLISDKLRAVPPLW